MWEKELLAAIEVGKRASVKIMEFYRNGFDIEIKEDDSPVTQADKMADELIFEYLKKEFPAHAFLTEESEDNLSRLENDFVWIIDPIDGTKNFIARDDEFTVNIALSYKHEIVVGVVAVPAKDEIYFASKGQGAFHVVNDKATQIHVNDKLENLTVLTSVFHSNDKERALIEKHKDKITKVEKYGSSLKPCRIAAGLAEISYRQSSGTKEWDTAASDIIVTEAGGIFIEPNGKKLTYNRKDVYNRNGYIICNRKENILL